jgi:hypothetical protein
MVAVAGVVILIVGAIVLAYGWSSPVNSTTTTNVSTQPVPTSHRDIDAGGTWSFGAQVTNGEALTGTVSVSGYNASAGPIFFYIQNESQYINWGNCAPCASPSISNYTLSSSGGSYSFNVNSPMTGGIYLSFDDEYYGQPAQATVQVSGSNSVSTATTAPNYNVDYLGIALIIIGALVAALGLAMGSKRPATK